MKDMARWAIGIDLGGTAVKVAVIGEKGDVLDHERHETRIDDGPDGIARHLASRSQSMYSRFCGQCGKEMFAGIGVGAPGAVHTGTGIVCYPPNLPGWDRYALRDTMLQVLAEEYGLRCPLVLENDANMAACGEAVFGAGQEYDDFMMITMGTGVGGGIVIDRKLYRGTRGTAGEIGFVTVDYRGERVHAGVRGTVESLIGKNGIVAMGVETYRNHPVTAWSESFHGSELKDLSPRTLEKAAHQGDPVALEVWNNVGAILGIGLAGVVALLDIRTFLIGGGVAGAGELIFAPARKQLSASLLPSMRDGIEIVAATLGNLAGVYGAAARCFSFIV